MEIREINLNYNRKDFEELYYGNENFIKSIFKSNKSDIYFFLVLTLLLFSSILYYYITGKSPFMITFIIIFFFIKSYDIYQITKSYLTWKNNINDYLNDLDKINKSKIVITNNTFSLIQDEKENIEKWSEFTKLVIETSFLHLYTNKTNYLFPKGSMNAEEFEFLKNILKTNIIKDVIDEKNLQL